MNYFVLIAVITLHGGKTVEKEMTSISSNVDAKQLCEQIKKDPAHYVPQIYLKPIEGETGRVYECREVVYAKR